MKPLVIEILSDSEEKEEMNKQQLLLIQKQIKDQACLLSDPTNLMIAVQKQFINAQEQEKDLILAQRIKKMFIDKYQFDIDKDYYCVRREPKYNAEGCALVLTELIVYGTDLWPVRMIKKQGDQLGILLEVLKIDESHAKLKFADFDTAKKWLSYYMKDKNIFSLKMEQEGENIQEQGSDPMAKLKGWFDLQPYEYQKFVRHRWVRFATTLQSDLGQLIQQTVTTAFLRFKQAIASSLLQTPEAKQSYYAAQQRNRHFRKQRRGELNRVDQHDSHASRYYPKETIHRTRQGYHGHRDRYDRSRNKRYDRRDSSRQNHRREHEQPNNTMFNNSIAHTQQGENRQNVSTVTAMYGNEVIPTELRDKPDNLESLLDSVSESNHHDVSITKQFDKMKLEQGEIQARQLPSDDMSIDLISVEEMQRIKQKKAELDASILDAPVSTPPTHHKKQQSRRHDGNNLYYKKSRKSEEFDYNQYVKYLNQKDAENLNKFSK